MAKGRDVRKEFLDKWTEEKMSFIYHRDFKLMVKDVFAFEAYIAAYTAFLKHKGLCEAKPKGYPKTEAWVEYPGYAVPSV